MTIIYESNFITMMAGQPRASHVAVRDGRILAVGTAQECLAWGDAPINTDFATRTICPGFVEGHSHLLEGILWDHHYVGFYDRQGPDGAIHKGLKSIEAVVAHLRAMARESDGDTPLVAWGFDPIYFDRRMRCADLDTVAEARPVIVLHASLHILNTNSLIIEKSGVKERDNNELLRRDESGHMTGEFLGPIGMFMAMRAVGLDIFVQSVTPAALENFANVARRNGVTTATDLATPLQKAEVVAALQQTTAQDDFPLRVVTALQGNPISAEDACACIHALHDQQTDKLRMSIIKLIADGSIQGFTARLAWPGYFNGAENGLWYIEPHILQEKLTAFTAAGIQTHIHANGDETIEVALGAIDHALRHHPWRDHRHTLQHCQMANRAQFKKMHTLGVGVNLFSNHLYYWGDAHAAITMGAERAARIDNAGCALAENVPLALHTDAPITALSPLFAAWCAVERTTSGGHVLGGDAEKISVAQALEAITLGAAYSLKLDHEIGSLEVGKRADFAILDRDPLAGAAAEMASALKDAQIIGTMLGGKIFLNA